MRAKAALEENLKINLKAISGGSLEQRGTQIPLWQAKLRSPSVEWGRQHPRPCRGSGRAAVTRGDKSDFYRDALG